MDTFGFLLTYRYLNDTHIYMYMQYINIQKSSESRSGFFNIKGKKAQGMISTKLVISPQLFRK